MTRAALIAVVETERRRAHDAIEDAYWRFTRSRSAAPPAVTVPWAYDVRSEMDRRLRRLRSGAGRSHSSKTSTEAP